jgi:predicted HTH domain antitoxin
VTKQIALEFPEEVFSTIKEDPESFGRELKLAAAVKWYELGKISQEKAARLAGLTRKEFIEALQRFAVSPVQYGIEEIREELSRG